MVMFPFCLTIPFLHISSCSRLVKCCHIIIHLLIFFFCSASVCFKFLKISWFFLSAARGFLETVPVGLSAHGMCVHVTLQCESQNEASIESSVVLCCRRCDLRFVRCCPGGGATDWPTAITVGGDELHMQPPAVLLLSRKVLCWAC